MNENKVQAAVEEIFMGGRDHPLAGLARTIDRAIREAEFQGLAPFDVARWVAHVVAEERGKDV